uniref:Uncharacterized protein n=1 Tax=Trichuris muris TaxID=70415 RepID=A0A5S6QI19_TRIMR
MINWSKKSFGDSNLPQPNPLFEATRENYLKLHDANFSECETVVRIWAIFLSDNRLLYRSYRAGQFRKLSKTRKLHPVAHSFTQLPGAAKAR